MKEMEDGILLTVEEISDIGNLCLIAASYCEQSILNLKKESVDSDIINKFKEKEKVAREYKRLFSNFFRSRLGLKGE